MSRAEIAFCILLLCGVLRGQDSARVDYGRLAGVGGITAVFFAYGQVSNYDLYWGDPSPFHVMGASQEYDDALLADKAGHLYASYGLASIYKEAFEWCGVERHDAALYGGGVSLLYQVYVEINDGFSGGKPYLGFSFGDIAADLAGAGLPWLLIEAGAERTVTLKASFQKAPNYSTEKANSLLNDYESTYHWVTVNTNALLPSGMKSEILDYVNIALGHSVKNIDRYGAGNHELYISLDWNLGGISTGIEILDRLIRILDMYKLPAPAVRLYPDIAWYGLKF